MSPDQIRIECAKPKPSSASSRRAYTPAPLPPRARARSSITANPMPNSSENKVMNLPCTST